MTERRALEKRAADAEALSAMGTLALNLAHEIRNPLNAAVLQLHLLGRHVDKLADRRGDARGAAAQGADRRRRDRAAEPAADRVPRARAPARRRARARALRQAGRRRARPRAGLRGRARGVEVERELASDCVLVGDPEKLKQVVLNLVVNALEAMKEGGTLGVARHVERRRGAPRRRRHGRRASTPASLAQVFDPFFTTKEAGTGLGLSIVRKIVDQHRGEVRIESEQGVGTRVDACVAAPRGAAEARSRCSRRLARLRSGARLSARRAEGSARRRRGGGMRGVPRARPPCRSPGSP